MLNAHSSYAVPEALKRYAGFGLFGWAHALWIHLPYCHRGFSRRGAWQAAVITALAAVQSVLGLVDWAIYGRRVASAEAAPVPPIFVIGHYRTGTTLMQNILCANAAHVTFVPAFVCYFPWTCLLLRRTRHLIGRYLLRDLRAYDNVDKDVDTPFEEASGIGLMTGLGEYPPSLFLSTKFPCPPTTTRVFTIGDAPAYVQRLWCWALDLLLRRTAVYNALEAEARPSSCPAAPKTLVLKTNCNTARMLLLARRFPGATFVFMHRQPEEVYRSSCTLAREWDVKTTLDGEPPHAEVRDMVLSVYETKLRAYLHDREQLPPNCHLLEVGFAELVAEPEAVARRVFAAAGIPVDGDVLRAYCAKLASYRRPHHPGATSAELQLVQERWAFSFAPFGYDPWAGS